MVKDLKKSLFIFCIFCFFSFSTFPTEGDDPGLVGHVGSRHWERGGFVPVDIRGRDLVLHAYKSRPAISLNTYRPS